MKKYMLWIAIILFSFVCVSHASAKTLGAGIGDAAGNMQLINTDTLVVPAAVVGTGVLALSICNGVYVAKGAYPSGGRLTCGIIGGVVGLGGVVGGFALFAREGASSPAAWGMLLASGLTTGLAAWNLALHRERKLTLTPTMVGTGADDAGMGLALTGRF